MCGLPGAAEERFKSEAVYLAASVLNLFPKSVHRGSSWAAWLNEDAQMRSTMDRFLLVMECDLPLAVRALHSASVGWPPADLATVLEVVVSDGHEGR